MAPTDAALAGLRYSAVGHCHVHRVFTCLTEDMCMCTTSDVSDVFGQDQFEPSEINRGGDSRKGSPIAWSSRSIECA